MRTRERHKRACVFRYNVNIGKPREISLNDAMLYETDQVQ